MTMDYNTNDYPEDVEERHRFFYSSSEQDFESRPYIGEKDSSFTGSHKEFIAQYEGKNYDSFGELE